MPCHKRICIGLTSKQTKDFSLRKILKAGHRYTSQVHRNKVAHAGKKNKRSSEDDTYRRSQVEYQRSVVRVRIISNNEYTEDISLR